MTDLPIYLINLDGSDDRLRAASAALHGQGAVFERQPAFDGRGKRAADLPHYDVARTQRFMGRALSGGEVGCFISHVEAAKRFVDTQAPFGLVLEDDMHPAPRAMDMVRALTQQQKRPDWHVAHLAAATIKLSTPASRISVGDQSAILHRAHYFPMRTTALLWALEGAQRFIKNAYPITCPVDIHLRRWLQMDDKGVALIPAPFATTEAQSEIGAEAGGKRGGKSRGTLYPLKRAGRVITDKHRARALQRRAAKGAPDDNT